MRKSFLIKITWIAIIGILLVSLLPNIISSYWLIDIFSNFKLQYLFLSILLLIVVIFLLKKKIVALILITVPIVWNGSYIAPYYLTSNNLKSTKQGDFKISSINLLSSNSRTDLVKNYIEKEDPDILILMEFTPEWKKELVPIMENYQYKQLVPRRDNFGIALLSKFKMKSSIDYFGLNDKPSIVGDITIEDKKYSLIATHPIPPINQRTFENRNKQLSNIINNRTRFSENLIVIGDFNTSSFSNHFVNLLQGDLKDSRIGFGLLPTWPADFEIFQTTLDHCLVSTNLDVLERSNGENIGSDHLPINIVIGAN
jgi:endonuclease/exonuclease/phosphatase (EEP) superfamily protein YafD